MHVGAQGSLLGSYRDSTMALSLRSRCWKGAALDSLTGFNGGAWAGDKDPDRVGPGSAEAETAAVMVSGASQSRVADPGAAIGCSGIFLSSPLSSIR